MAEITFIIMLSRKMSLQIQDFSLLKKDSVSSQTNSQKGVKGHTTSQLWVLPASPRVDSPLPLLEQDMKKGESQKPTWAVLPGTSCMPHKPRLLFAAAIWQSNFLVPLIL